MQTIRTENGLSFDADVAGPSGGALVLLLHGFGVSRHFWQAQVAALGAAGYHAIAPDQRGYSPGARPDPADPANYHYEHLLNDAIAIVDATGHAGQRIHLAGHDWGGSLAWLLADRIPERLASLAILSRPHPSAFVRALALPDGDQAYRSRHHQAFLQPGAAADVLADDAKWLRTRHAAQSVPPPATARHLQVLGHPAAMEAAIAWYKARGALRTEMRPTEVPTLYIWGDADDTVGRAAAEGTVDFIAAPYVFAELPGVGHYAADQVPDEVSRLMLEHLVRHPA